MLSTPCALFQACLPLEGTTLPRAPCSWGLSYKLGSTSQTQVRNDTEVSATEQASMIVKMGLNSSTASPSGLKSCGHLLFLAQCGSGANTQSSTFRISREQLPCMVVFPETTVPATASPVTSFLIVEEAAAPLVAELCSVPQAVILGACSFTPFYALEVPSPLY